MTCAFIFLPFSSFRLYPTDYRSSTRQKKKKKIWQGLRPIFSVCTSVKKNALPCTMLALHLSCNSNLLKVTLVVLGHRLNILNQVMKVKIKFTIKWDFFMSSNSSNHFTHVLNAWGVAQVWRWDRREVVVWEG